MFRKVEESPTLLINTLSKKLEANGKEIVKFGFGQSPFLPPKKVLKRFRKSVKTKHYSSVQGDIKLREQIADFHFRHNGLKVSKENIMTAPGSKILIHSILCSFLEADVFLPAPAWVSYAPQAKLAGHPVIRVETNFENRWRITRASILEAFKKKQHKASILILNYPGNPDGLTYSEAELLDLAAVARELDILVISDEIYGLLTFDQEHLSFANFYPEKTITTTGLSKWCGAGGWRFGAALLYEGIEDAFKAALIGIASETYSCAPTPVQMAAKGAYGDFDKSIEYVHCQNTILKEVSFYCYQELTKTKIRLHPPQGGFYLFPDFSAYRAPLAARRITTSIGLCQKLLEETGVALLPAAAFGFADDYLAARLAYVDFEDPLGKSSFVLERDCPKVVLGIRKIREWLGRLC